MNKTINYGAISSMIFLSEIIADVKGKCNDSHVKFNNYESSEISEIKEQFDVIGDKNVIGIRHKLRRV